MRVLFPGRCPPGGSVPVLLVLLFTWTMTTHAERTIRIACVGDSITYGLRIEDRAQHSYPAVLQRLAGDGVAVENFGVSGTTLLKAGHHPYWTTAAFRDATAFEPDIVVIKLGTNDSKFRNRRQLDDFADDLRDLIDHFAALPSAPKIWVCLPAPMYGLLRYPDHRTLRDRLIPVLTEIAREKGVPVIDVHTALANEPEWFPDGVHPNAAGAQQIAETVWEAIRNDLPSKP